VCFSQVLNFVRVAVNARKVNLVAIDRSLNVSDDDDDVAEFYSVTLPVDAQLHEFTVSVSGKAPHIAVIDPQGPYVHLSTSAKRQRTRLTQFYTVGVQVQVHKNRTRVGLESDSSPRRDSSEF